MDTNKAIRNAVETGDVKIGMKETKKAYLAGTLKMVITSGNCPVDYRDEIELWEIPIHKFKGANLALGSVCGKPFAISVLGIIDPGKSPVLEAVNS